MTLYKRAMEAIMMPMKGLCACGIVISIIVYKDIRSINGADKANSVPVDKIVKGIYNNLYYSL